MEKNFREKQVEMVKNCVTVEPFPRKADLWKLDDLLYALENAAEFLELEECSEPSEAEAQIAANREGARRIRLMVAKLQEKI